MLLLPLWIALEKLGRLNESFLEQGPSAHSCSAERESESGEPERENPRVFELWVKWRKDFLYKQILD